MLRRTCLASIVAAVAAVSTAHAGLLPINVTVNPDGTNFRWTYAIVLPTDMKLEAGNYFTIYDFAGYVPGGESAPANWTFTASQVGPTPDRLKPDDDSSLWNLSWKYTGPTIPSGQVGLGNFWAISSLQNPRDDFFTATTKRTSDGIVDNNITDTVVPMTEPTTPPPGVPEPGTLALAALGLPLVGLVRMLKRRKE